MKIRHATIADIPRMASVAAAAWHDDELIAYLAPYRDKFPRDYHAMWVSMFRDFLLQPYVVVLVAETEPGITDLGKSVQIIGLAVWRLYAPSRGFHPELRKDSLSYKLARTWTKASATFCWWRKDRSASRAAERDFNRCVAEEWRDFWEAEHRQHWHLMRLCTDPKWQRHGVGTALVERGMELADEEDLMVGLEASKAGFPLYKKLGFVQVGAWDLADPNANLPIMMWPADVVKKIRVKA